MILKRDGTMEDDYSTSTDRTHERKLVGVKRITENKVHETKEREYSINIKQQFDDLIPRSVECEPKNDSDIQMSNNDKCERVGSYKDESRTESRLDKEIPRQDSISMNESSSNEQETFSMAQHRDFVSAIFEVGISSCSPSVILEMMRTKDPLLVTRERAKSRLQKFRKGKSKGKSKLHICSLNLSQ